MKLFMVYDKKLNRFLGKGMRSSVAKVWLCEGDLKRAIGHYQSYYGKAKNVLMSGNFGSLLKMVH